MGGISFDGEGLKKTIGWEGALGGTARPPQLNSELEKLREDK